MNTSNKLNTPLQKIKKLFDTVKVETTSMGNDYIDQYYTTNKLSYSILHSRTDAVHMAISRDGKYKERDLFVAVERIAGYVRKTNAISVLELGCGRGINSVYLSKQFSNTSFEGLDLSLGQLDFAYKRARTCKNFHPRQGDFHDLSQYLDNHFDVVFVIESLCHSTDKEKVLREVKRVLKPNGFFIIFDGYLQKEEKSMKKEEIEAVRLLAMGMAVPFFETYDHFLAQARKAGLKVDGEEDLSRFVMPNLRRFERLAKSFLMVPFLVPVMLKYLPEKLTWNIISGILVVPTMEEKLTCYYFTSLQKKVTVSLT